MQYAIVALRNRCADHDFVSAPTKPTEDATTAEASSPDD
jgi:hypothetical protein